jgi:hypothetical protein
MAESIRRPRSRFINSSIHQLDLVFTSCCDHSHRDHVLNSRLHQNMALSSHLIHSFEHQRALSTYRQLYHPPTQGQAGVKREPFTPQYIITTSPPPEPQYSPGPSESYNQSHGKPPRNRTAFAGTSRMDMNSNSNSVQGDRKPPITQRTPQVASHAFAVPPPSPLNNWEHHAPADPTSSSLYGGYGQTQTQTRDGNQTQGQAQAQAQGQPEENTQYMQMSAYTAGQIATLQSRLQKQLGPEYINHRPGPGGGPALR